MNVLQFILNVTMNAKVDSITMASRLKITSAVSVVFALIVFCVAIYFARMRSENLIKEQIINRDASVLYSAICLMRDEYMASEMPDLDSPAEQMNLVLKISNLKGVVAIRLFDKTGKFENGLPVSVKETDLGEEELAFMKALKPHARFHKGLKVGDIFYFAPDDFKNGDREFSILEINIPLHGRNSADLKGIAQFLLEGTSVQSEFVDLEKNLNAQSVIIFAIGSLLIGGGLGFAFLKLNQRTLDLQKANRELALAARASALGAITANLIHGLKNPLAGLQIFASDRATNGDSSVTDWEQALKSIQRMKTMIAEVSNFIKEETGATNIELTIEELAEMVSNKTKLIARQRSVNFNVENHCPDKRLRGRVANLISIILVNLIENGIEATPPGKNVWVKIRPEDNAIAFDVIDEGCGLPEAMIENPFLPRQSSKPGGSGIGLAISKQLANHLGAELKVKWTSDRGTCFELIIPV